MDTTEVDIDDPLLTYDTLDIREAGRIARAVCDGVDPALSAPRRPDLLAFIPPGTHQGPHQGIFVINNHREPAYSAQFPEHFNPRKAQSMSAQEKVSKWILQVPFSHNDDAEILMDCYPGVVDFSSSTSSTYEAIDYPEPDSLLELQARKITRLVTNHYLREQEFSSSQPENDNSFYEYASENIGLGYDQKITSFDLTPSHKKGDHLVQALF